MSIKTVHVRVADPVFGSIYIERELPLKAAVRAVSRARRLGSPNDTWCFVRGARTEITWASWGVPQITDRRAS